MDRLCKSCFELCIPPWRVDRFDEFIDDLFGGLLRSAPLRILDWHRIYRPDLSRLYFVLRTHFPGGWWTRMMLTLLHEGISLPA